MPRKSELPLSEAKNLRLVDGDFEAMGVMFPALGASVAIRTLVHNYVRRVRASLSPLDIDLSAEQFKEVLND